MICKLYGNSAVGRNRRPEKGGKNMAGKTLDSRRMGEVQEGRLLLGMAVPMILSMLVQALYNIVDSI